MISIIEIRINLIYGVNPSLIKIVIIIEAQIIIKIPKYL